MYINSDQSKKVQFNVRAGQTKGAENSFKRTSFSVRMSYVPINSFNVSLSARINSNQQELQYVTTNSYGGNSRYINASLDQDTFNLSLRLNYTLSPTMSIQYYGSPFISRGRYTNFKYITNSLANKFTDRFQQYSNDQISYDSNSGSYLIDENSDSATDYSIGNPNFSFIQFQSNLVARWEYIPGSEIFLVWSKGLTTYGDPMEKLIPSLKDNIADQTPHNIFLIKATYRFMM